MQNTKILKEDIVLELKKFARMHNNIMYIYANRDAFVIIIDDILSPTVLSYYDFCTDLVNSCDVINEFHIFDLQEAMVDKNYILIYERD